VTYTDSQGAVRKIDWALTSTAESRQMLAKHAQIKDQLQAPFLIEYAQKTAKAEAEEEAEEVASEEGVAAEAAAPGTVAETKPAKRNSKISQDPVEKKTAREVFEYVIEQGKKEYQVQRYKGLGEMTAPQLWDTTMDPERRTLLQVRLEDIAACEEIFTTLMGEDVEARRKFIEENALDVKNLDI
jgi:DNA gyrase subunit B